jgi:glycosyltransferase involved in cell wall biosynthesis
MRALQVAIVAPSLRILGGHAVQADRLLRAWRGDPDVNAWLVPINPTLPGPLRSLASIRYARTIATELTYIPSLFREIRHADVVHVFAASYTSFLLAPLPALVVARCLGKPVVLNYRSGQAPEHLRRSAVARRALAWGGLNIVPSRFLVDVFARFGIQAGVIPNIVDLERFAFRPRPTVGPRLLSTRNLEPLYNVRCTLRAFRIVQDRWPDATLTLVGGGSEERALRALASTLGLRHVTFVGRVDPDEIAHYYAQSDIYVQTPNLDNMPTSVLEASACGLPIVATRAGGVPAIVTSEENGLLAPLDDHRAIADHVLRLLEEPDLARRLAAAAHAECGARTWPAVRELWLSAYRSAATRAPAASLLSRHARDNPPASAPPASAPPTSAAAQP